MIDFSKDFTLYFHGTIKYDGRASSILENGNYLLIKKADNSIQIHGSSNISPLNYQPSNCKLSYNNSLLTCHRKNELLEINITNIISITYLDEWSNNSIKLIKSEADLVNKLINNITDYIDLPNEFTIEREYRTDYGPIDILIKTDNIIHIIEVKRKLINTSACVQVRKYGEQFERSILYVAGPKIGKPATKYAREYNVNFIDIGFD
jgi:hypothetical protein